MNAFVQPSRHAEEPRILVISPVRNEAAHIERVVRAVAAQDVPPTRWIVVDDESDDGTLEILRRLEPEVPFMTVLHTADMPLAPVKDRLAVAAEVRTFNLGLAAAGDLTEYTHVMKLDGDIELVTGYFATLTERFAASPSLGLAGGVLAEPTTDGGLRHIRIARTHVHGALKCYTRECFVAIGGIQQRLAWDTIDETYARMRGYTVVSFTDLESLHLRPLGSADGVLRGHARHGECAYISHFTPTWVALRSLKIMVRPPYVISGAAFFLGYLRAAALRRGRIDDRDYRRFTHRELRRRMFAPLASILAGLRPGRAPEVGA
jgi:biofilm PGA synthesis N-glycosyltransferase PgaC